MRVHIVNVWEVRLKSGHRISLLCRKENIIKTNSSSVNVIMSFTLNSLSLHSSKSGGVAISLRPWNCTWFVNRASSLNTVRRGPRKRSIPSIKSRELCAMLRSKLKAGGHANYSSGYRYRRTHQEPAAEAAAAHARHVAVHGAEL